MGMPSEHVADLLVTAGVGAKGTLTDWSIWFGRQQDKPDRTITLYDTGGSGISPKWLLDEAVRVQARVRGARGDYKTARQKAVDIQTALVGIPPQVMGDGDRIDGIIQVGGIAFLGYDANERPEHVINLELIIEPAPPAGTHREPL